MGPQNTGQTDIFWVEIDKGYFFAYQLKRIILNHFYKIQQLFILKDQHSVVPLPVYLNSNATDRMILSIHMYHLISISLIFTV